MRIWSTEHTYSHPWDSVTAAIWRKYPNEKAPHVISVDTISCKHDPKTRVLRTKRLLRVRQNVPSFVVRLFSSAAPTTYVLEETEVDLARRVVKSVSRNMTFRDLVTVEERVEYSPDKKVPQKHTRFLQETEVKVNLLGVSSYLEELVINKVRSNASKGQAALEGVIERLLRESGLGQSSSSTKPSNHTAQSPPTQAPSKTTAKHDLTEKNKRQNVSLISADDRLVISELQNTQGSESAKKAAPTSSMWPILAALQRKSSGAL